MLEAAGLLDDDRQRAAIRALEREYEAEAVRGDRDRDGSLVVDLWPDGESSPVCRARVGLAGDVLVDVTETIA
jgi:hypothetical protein